MEREGNVSLVERTNLVTGSAHFELVQLQHRPAHRWPDGTTSPAVEVYPGPKQWGVAGWTYTDLAAARVRFAEVVGNQFRRTRSSGPTSRSSTFAAIAARLS